MFHRVSSLLILLLVCVGAPRCRGEAANEVAGVKSMESIPAETRAAMEKFAHQFEADLRANDPVKLMAFFNPEATVALVCKDVDTNAEGLDAFKSGLSEGVTENFTTQIRNWRDADGKFKGLALYDGQLALRFRFAKDDISIVDLVLQKDAEGNLRIVEYYHHSTGSGLVELLHQAVMPTLSSLDPRAVSPALKGLSLTDSQMEEVKIYFEKAQNQDFADVVAAYPNLPSSVREGRLATISHVVALLKTGDQSAYKTALQEAAAKFTTANFQFMMIGLCLQEKRFADSLRAIDAITNIVGPDATLLLMKANVQKLSGDIEAARGTLREGLALEPDCLYAHRLGLEVLLAAHDNEALRDSLRVLEKSGRLKVSAMLKADPQWKQFRETPEAAEWKD